MGLALVAVPLVVFVEDFRLLEFIKAVIDGNILFSFFRIGIV